MISPRQTLGNYYNDPAAKKSFLKQVFDAGARDYDFVERLLSLGTGADIAAKPCGARDWAPA